MNNVLKAIDGLKKKVEGVNALVEESCITIANKANSTAPKDVLVFAIGNEVIAEGTSDKGKAWAAYTEFGTGDFFAENYTATLPEEWDKYARGFRISGKGNREQSPYLFPAYETERVQLIKKIKEAFGKGGFGG